MFRRRTPADAVHADLEERLLRLEKIVVLTVDRSDGPHPTHQPWGWREFQALLEDLKKDVVVPLGPNEPGT